jgi:hypothetical protein
MKKIVLLTVLAVLIILPAKTRGQIRYNQVGCYPQQEKFIVVEDTASIHKLKIKTPKGKTLKQQVFGKLYHHFRGRPAMLSILVN